MIEFLEDKIIILGERKVGKTSLLSRYLIQNFKEKKSSSNDIGASYWIKEFKNGDKVQIWDITDLGKLKNDKALTEQIFSNPLAVILIFDISKISTFNAIPNWITELLEFNKNNLVPMALVGNKMDLRSKQKCISTETGFAYAGNLSSWAQMRIPYFEVTARDPSTMGFLDEFMENLDYYISFYKKLSHSDAKKIQIADQLYNKVRRRIDKGADFAEYLKYIKEHTEDIEKNFQA